MPKPKPPRQPRASRPWRTPPAPVRRAHETIRGVEILTELPGPLGRFLWLLFRDVELWAASTPAVRPRLFRGPIHLPREATPGGIAADVRTLLALVRSQDAAGEAVACRNIAAWAADAAPSTALYYAWAAAAVRPASGAFAREVGTHARRLADVPLAEAWLRRAIALARAEGGWATYGRATCDLAELLAERGQHARAHAAFVRTMKVCRRHGLPRALRARALLGRLRIALMDESHDDAGHLQLRLLRLYAAGHPHALRTRIAIARALVDHGGHAAAVDLLSVPALQRGAEEDRATAAALLAFATARATEAD